MKKILTAVGACALAMLAGCYNEIAPEHPSQREGMLPIAGAANVRDLGGYRGYGGRTVRYGMLVRSGELSGLSARDQRRFEDMNITTVVDLRAGEFLAALDFTDGLDVSERVIVTERTHAATRLWEGAAIWDERTPQAFLTDNTGILETTVIPDYEDIIRGMPGFGSVTEVVAFVTNRYTFLVTEPITSTTPWTRTDTPRSQYLSFFRALLDAGGRGEAVLFHCSAGKDRAGVATALLFLALGVSEEDIVTNYMISFDAVTERFFPVVPMIRRSVAEDMREMQPGAQQLAGALAQAAGNQAMIDAILAPVRADVTRSVQRGAMQSAFNGMVQAGMPQGQAVTEARLQALGAYGAGFLNTSIEWALGMARDGMVDLAAMDEAAILAEADFAARRIAPLLSVHTEWIRAAITEVRRLGGGDIDAGIVRFLNYVEPSGRSGEQIRDALRGIYLEG